jgi:hypothetical protein
MPNDFHNDMAHDDEATASELLSNELGIAERIGPFYHDCAPGRSRAVRDNFSETGPRLEPPDNEATHIKVGVDLWSLIDWTGNVGAQYEAELRRWSKFLADKADAVAKRWAEHEAYLAELHERQA